MYKRTALAQQIADRMLSTSQTGAASAGLFLSAPRRTGKSTFLREDLLPELVSRQAEVIYVDLWSDPSADPGDLIVSAVRAALAKYDHALARIAKSLGIEKVGVGGSSISLDRIGLSKDVSISNALSTLSDEIKRPIVLLIDEAQHAITSKSGYDALFALKAARDELNSSAHHGLRILATGSNRDKLAMLRNSKDQAFFSAPLIAFPHLDQNYITWFCQNADLAAPLDEARCWALFQEVGYRPEPMNAALDVLRFDFELVPDQVNARFQLAVHEQVRASNEASLRVLHALPPVQSAVVRVMCSRGMNFAPFEAKTVELYRLALQSIAPSEEIRLETPNIQQALIALQEKGLIWKEQRGVYAIEDASICDLMRAEGMLDALGDQP